DDLTDRALLVQRGGAMLEVLLDLVLVPGVGVDDVPAIHGFLDDEVDDLLRDPVGEAEVEAGDDHEAEHDTGGLCDLTAIRPLHALELGPGRAQEVDEAVAAGGGDAAGLAGGDGALAAGGSGLDRLALDLGLVDVRADPVVGGVAI